MILILSEKANTKQIVEVTKAYSNYTKVVVDVEKELLAAGGEYHADCEQVLLANNSIQSNLWSGGYRFNTKEVDFMGLTNYKPNINHLSYEIAIPEIRQKVEQVIRQIFDEQNKT